MKSCVAVLCLFAMIGVASAGTKSGGSLSPCNSGALFLDSMPENFGQYVTTEIMSQNLKVSVTTDASKAVCVMRGTVVLGGFRNTGSASIQVVGPNGDVIWSATSGDKDSVKDLAHNLVKQLKHDIPTPAKTR